VIDRRLELDSSLNLFDNSVETLIFNEVKSQTVGRNKYIALEDFDRYVPQYIMYQLYLQDIQSVIVEGGARTLQTFIDAGMWDEARVFTGKSIMDKGIPAPSITGSKHDEFQSGEDLLEIWYNR